MEWLGLSPVRRSLVSHTEYSVEVNGDDSFLEKIEEATSKIKWASGDRPTDISVYNYKYLDFEAVNWGNGFKYKLTRGNKYYGKLVSQGFILNMLGSL